jgi:non-heme chloroperoxidase
MSTITTPDGTSIFYKDWGPRGAQPIVFHHGWPLSADDWDIQMLFFLAKGYRVIAHDRRGHGCSTQTATGHEMDTYAADVVARADALDLKGAFHVGHSTGGGEVARRVLQGLASAPATTAGPRSVQTVVRYGRSRFSCALYLPTQPRKAQCDP